MIRFFEEFEKIICDYGIEHKDVCLVGSSVLTEKGFRENRDVDFAVTEEARAKLLNVYRNEINVLPSGTICFSDNVQIGRNRYIELGIDNNLLFAEEYSVPYVNGLRIAKIEVEIAKKIARFNVRDEADLKAIGTSEKLEFVDWKQILTLVCSRRKSSSVDYICSHIKSLLFFLKGKCIPLFKGNEKIKYVKLQKQGVFCAILWGTIEQYFDAAEADIARHHKIVKSVTIDHLSNMGQFVYDIYSIDNADVWKIKLKQAYLSEIVPSVRIVLFEIKNPNFRTSERTGGLLSDEEAKIKSKIRNKYKKKLNRYICDVIIHIGDNYDISKKMLEVIKNYGGLSGI